jgi:ribosomal protein S19
MVKIGKRLGLFGRMKKVSEGEYLWSKRGVILAEDVGKVVYVYNGKGFRELLVEEGMEGHKYGEYILTKRIGGQIHKKKKERKRKV